MASKPKRTVTTATEALKVLWEEGVFKTARTRPIVEEQLAERGYNFSGPELGMALMRAKHLTRRGRAGRYEYIQKYPYAEEE